MFRRMIERVIGDEIVALIYQKYMVGKWWYRQEVDLLEVSNDEDKIIVNECK